MASKQQTENDTERPRDLRGRYTDRALTFVGPLINQAEDLEVTLDRLGKEMRDAPFEVDTGCDSTKRNPLMSIYCDLNKAYRMTIQQLMDAEDGPPEGGSWLDEMRKQSAAKRFHLMPDADDEEDSAEAQSA